jgi:hypothetical protein
MSSAMDDETRKEEEETVLCSEQPLAQKEGQSPPGGEPCPSLARSSCG